MAYCTNCGKTLAADAKSCAACGTEVAAATQQAGPKTVFCQNCGRKQPVDGSYCVECGARLVVPVGTGPATNVVAHTAPSPQTPGEAVSPKSRLVTLLLAFFLGPLGIHRFYLGKTGSGIVMLVLTLTFVGLIVSGIWAFIDVIIIAVGSARDSRGRRVAEWRG